MERENRLLGLEAGRFVAALLVTCFHFSLAFQEFREINIFDMAFRAGHAGVEYFFVLSGFIIYYIHRGDLGQPSRVYGFAAKRFIRLYPMYLAVFAAMLLAFLFVPSLAGERELAPGALVLDGLLLPTNGEMVVLQSWTLRHEVVFYAIFAIAIFNARAGLIALAVWQMSSLVVGLIYPDSLPVAMKPFLYLYNIGFGIGIATAWATFRWQPRNPGIIALVGLFGFFAAMTIEWNFGRDIPSPALPLGPRLSPIIYLSTSALIIFGVTQMEKVRALPFARALKILGGSSYLLYLLHAGLGSVLIRVFGMRIFSFLPNEFVFGLMVSASVVAAILGHLLVEKPVLRFLRARLLKPRDMPRAEAAAAA